MSIYWRQGADGTSLAYINIAVKGLPRLRESTGIRSDEPDAKRRAQEYHDQRRAELWRIARLGERPARFWHEAVVQWVSERGAKRTIDKDIQRLRWMDPYLRDARLDAIDRHLVEKIMRAKEAEGVSPATVNRYAELIRAILNAAAHEWGWIDVAPRVRMRSEDNDRITWMTQAEAYGILLPQLAATAPHLYDAVELSLHTGFRESNIAALRWDQFSEDLRAAFIYRTKNGNPLGTPMNSVAQAVLERRRGMHPVYVFTWRGRPVTRFNNSAWQKALKRTLAEIGEPLPTRLDGFAWHSLRHTWASWSMQNGVPIEKLQLLGGWKKIEMAMRYAHLATAHLEPYSEMVAKSIKGLRVVK